MECSLAVDIGASNGRVIAGNIRDGKLYLQEIYRFENEQVNKNGRLYWDVRKLFLEIKTGIEKCHEYKITPVSIGVDTWGVDFVLLDENDQLLTEAISYRDSRTEGMMEEVFTFIDKREIYERTGIQFLPFNTLYQLYALRKKNKKLLNQARTFMMIPDYLHFLLTGKKVNEYTNASTTQLLNVHTKEWDESILKRLGLNQNIFQTISYPQTKIGRLRKGLSTEVGFDLEVILPATHDTGSAIFAAPMDEMGLYISSGTWSLIGIESELPLIVESAYLSNFTNEGGALGNVRLLRNIMGLWMIQEVQRQYNYSFTFSELTELAQKHMDFTATINVNDPRFLNPKNMITEIQTYCRDNRLQIPYQPGEIAYCIFRSLAFSYKQAADEIETITGKTFPYIHVIGGGSQNELLNRITAQVTEKTVIAGPTEATAIGNLMMQFIARNQIANQKEAKQIIRNSFELKIYHASGEEGHL